MPSLRALGAVAAPNTSSHLSLQSRTLGAKPKYSTKSMQRLPPIPGNLLNASQANRVLDMAAGTRSKFFPQFGGNAIGHELFDRPTHLRYLAHQTRAKVHIIGARH